MSEFATFGLLYKQPPANELLVIRPEPDSIQFIRNAFLALLAANVFVISGMICFGYLLLYQ